MWPSLLNGISVSSADEYCLMAASMTPPGGHGSDHESRLQGSWQEHPYPVRSGRDGKDDAVADGRRAQPGSHGEDTCHHRRQPDAEIADDVDGRYERAAAATDRETLRPGCDGDGSGGVAAGCLNERLGGIREAVASGDRDVQLPGGEMRHEPAQQGSVGADVDVGDRDAALLAGGSEVMVASRPPSA